MATNKEWGKLDGQTLTYAETWVILDGRIIINPSDGQYAASGWLHMVDSTPSPGSGYHVSGSRWVVQDGKIMRVWEYAPDEKIQRQFSKLKLYGAIAQLGAWDTVRTWLEGKTIEGLNGWMAFQLAQEISEGHPLFTELADECRGLLGLDETTFDKLLEGCILEA